MNCIKCGEEIPAGRLKALPGAKTCVNCSGVQKKGVVTIMKGEGDHTRIETIHLDHEDYVKYMEAEKKIKFPTELDPLDDSDIHHKSSKTKLEEE